MLSRFLAESRQQAHIQALATMLAWAQEGVRESDGPNRGPVVDAIHELAGGDDEDAAAWCARAVQAAWRIAGWATLQRLDPAVSRSGSVFYLLHETHKRAPELCILSHDVTFPTAEIKPGDAMIRYSVAPEFLDVPVWERKRSMTKSAHVELVVRVHPDGWLDTVGGNTDADDARDGDGVYLHRRRYSINEPRVVGFVRPRFLPLPP